MSILGSYKGLDSGTREWILKRHEREPQVSCIKLFESTHPGVDNKLMEKVGIYPNSYFDASFESK